jgi:hypothetical protein
MPSLLLLARKPGVCALVFSLAAIMTILPKTADCQQRNDVSQCFSPLLVTHHESSVIMHYQYLFLSLIDETNYSGVKADTSATALLPVGMFSGDFHYFQEQRRHYFELKNENIDFYLSKRDDIQFLPPEWRPTIDACIKQTLTSQVGLGYYAVDLDEYKVSLELKYRSDRSLPGPKVLDSTITDGYILDKKGNKLRQLYSDCWTRHIAWTCPRTDENSEFTVYRDNPNKKVHIALNLADVAPSTGIDLDILPKRIKCDETIEGVKPTYFKVEVSKNNPEWRTGVTYDSGKEEKDVLKIRTVIEGKILDVSCKTPDSGFIWPMGAPATLALIHMSKQVEWNDNGEAYCAYMTNTKDPRTVVVEGHYLKPKTECKTLDWDVKQ